MCIFRTVPTQSFQNAQYNNAVYCASSSATYYIGSSGFLETIKIHRYTYDVYATVYWQILLLRQLYSLYARSWTSIIHDIFLFEKLSDFKMYLSNG